MIRVSQNNVTCVEDLPVVEYEMPVEPSKDEVVKLITLLFPEEEHQQCAFTQFTDGLTNRLFKIRYSNSETKRELLIRVYGEKTELLIDRDKELSGMIALNQCGLAPPVYGKFTNGVCYGFISGTPFSVDDMKDNGKYPLVAEQLAKFHSAVVPDMEKTPSLFNTLRKWQKEVSHLQLSPSQEEILNGMYSDESFSNELLLLEEKMKDYKNWDIVFCHNDLLAGNLIYKDENVEFIDYEYGSYNYALFDIGNHFCEMMGPEVIVDVSICYFSFHMFYVYLLYLRNFQVRICK